MAKSKFGDGHGCRSLLLDVSLPGRGKHTGRWAATLLSAATLLPFSAFTAATVSGLCSLAMSVALPCLPRCSCRPRRRYRCPSRIRERHGRCKCCRVFLGEESFGRNVGVGSACLQPYWYGLLRDDEAREFPCHGGGESSIMRSGVVLILEVGVKSYKVMVWYLTCF